MPEMSAMQKLKSIVFPKVKKTWHYQLCAFVYGFAAGVICNSGGITRLLARGDVDIMQSFIPPYWGPHLFVAGSLLSAVFSGWYEWAVGRQRGYTSRPVFIGACALVFNSIFYILLYCHFTGKHPVVFIFEVILFMFISSIWVVYDSWRYNRKLHNR